VLMFSVVSVVLLAGATVGSTQHIAAVGQAVSSAGLPTRLTIPLLTVDAAVQHVGLTPDGAMDVPSGPAEVGWYRLGPKPGDIGSAVIDGHSGWKGGIPAAFDYVHQLRKGDKLYVENEQGVKIAFVVREIRTYDPDADAPEVFNSSDGKAHLNLITCSGAWDTTTKSSSSRLVVFTDKE